MKKNFLTRLSNLSAMAWIIILNVAVFIFLNVYIAFFSGDSLEQATILNYFALKPSNIFAGKYLVSLFLHMFTHLSFVHLLVNMFALFSLGGLCGRIIGRKRFVWFYLAAGLFAGILSVVLSGFFGSTYIGEILFGPPGIFMVGASGAIFGIAGLYVMLLPRLRFSIIFLPFFSVPGYILIPIVLFGIWIASIIAGFFGSSVPIGNVAHFGGFLVGIGYGYYLKKKYKKKVERLRKIFK